MKRLVAVFLAVTVPFIVACGSHSVTDPHTDSGGNDFPNSVLGKSVVLQLADLAMWETEMGAPPPFPHPSVGLYAPGILPAGRGSAAKRHADNGETIVDMSDTATGGVVRVYHRFRDDTSIVHDTLVFRWSPGAGEGDWGDLPLIEVRGHREVPGTLRSTAYLFTDGDGDGVIGTTAGRFNALRVVWIHRWGGVFALVTEQVLDAGPDADFNTHHDNRLLENRTTMLSGADTLHRTVLLDGDGDSVVIDYAGTAASLVDVEEHSPAQWWSGSTRRWSRTRYEVFPRDSTLNRVVRREEHEQQGARTVRRMLYGPAPDSTFAPGDTIGVLVVATPGPLEVFSVDTMHLRIAIAEHWSDAALIEGYRHIVRPTGTGERSFQLRSVLDPGLQSGVVLRSGTLFARRVDDKGNEEVVEGRFDHSGIAASYKGASGELFAVAWDWEGNLVSFSVQEPRE